MKISGKTIVCREQFAKLAFITVRMKSNLILVSILTFLIFFNFVNSSSIDHAQVKHVESIRDSIFEDILAQMNLTNEKILKDEQMNLYYIYFNETSAYEHEKCDYQINTLKFVNKTHTCYILGDKNNKLFDELSFIINQDRNSTDEIYLKDLYNIKNISKITDKLELENTNSKINFGIQSQPNFRSLASFHELNHNEINYRRNKLKRRYLDDDMDDSKLSKKEKKKRKKRKKMLKKREKELREKRKKYRSPLDKLRSTMKWMACIEISLAVCSCCFALVQAVVLPFISPIPFGSRIQPMNGQPIRGFEDYGFYGGFQQSNGVYNGLPLNNGNINGNHLSCNGNCNCNNGIKGTLGNTLGISGSIIGNNLFSRMGQLQRNGNA
ncbi:unnamed protein product [Cryptosporidium hominis]|uniref:Uncharacterized protein n=1 Tax=Cryptosporidium hominis TaxID=237895 RepID=A0A0S4TKI1_CRYHO|nr:hypothetical protein [Cryptosporidium hominis TU502]OLQ17372.1 hypothetical protein ChTU502y2012_405g0275 [Cryptosporidium hominis]PPA64443.1 hypothetical protein ChUKH1_07100 [Cryptosporidium hominis]PPS98005.1 Uncharacterized protein GY17_00000801 [Cryptosporidium hominis]CUV07910.1 unnamed protein product [Cryptosporidium hominis]|eukprot:PPS98005.1 Uncharacterized protein GY17_00000801 [Cryptosporidium hominis]